MSRKDRHKLFCGCCFFFKVAGNRKLKLTRLFNLGLPRLSGGHDGRGGLCDAAGRLLQAVQLGAVFVCFYLQKESSNNARDVKSLTSFPRVYFRFCQSNIFIFLKKTKLLCSPWKQPRAVLCWQQFHVSTPSAPQTSLCPEPPGQQHPCNNNTVQNKLKGSSDFNLKLERKWIFIVLTLAVIFGQNWEKMDFVYICFLIFDTIYHCPNILFILFSCF